MNSYEINIEVALSAQGYEKEIYCWRKPVIQNNIKFFYIIFIHALYTFYSIQIKHQQTFYIKNFLGNYNSFFNSPHFLK